MLVPIKWLGVAAAFALLPPATGCGGSEPASKSEYEERVGAIQARVEAAASRLQPGVSQLAAPGGIAGQFKEAQETLRAAADDLEDVEPPADIAGPHEQLTAGIRQFADDLEPAAKAAEGGNLAQLQAALRGLEQLPSAQQVRSAIDQIQRQGYRIGT